MVKYYELSNEYEPSIIGVTDGVSQAYVDEKFIERNLWYKNIFFENAKLLKDNWKIAAIFINQFYNIYRTEETSGEVKAQTIVLDNIYK